MIGKGKRIEDLYVLDTRKPYSDLIHVHPIIHSHNVSVYTWHNRLHHLYAKFLDVLKSQLHCNNSSSVTPCYICPLAKQRKLPACLNFHLI